MKISLKWIKELIDTNLNTDQLLEQLTDLGLECSSSSLGPSFKNVVVGRVSEVEKHGNSDHLSLCRVDIGEDELLQIVCGAPNVRKDILVPVAKVGASLGNGSFKIKKSKIRGEESSGMICSEKELDLSDSHEGIMILENECDLGTPLEKILKLDNDILIDFDLTPNRGDCLSFLGVAREIAILESISHEKLTNKVISDNIFDILENDEDIKDKISVNIENSEACPLYLGKIISGVEVKDSPEWLESKLNSLGMKSINIIVDLANYVMLTLGQPMHTFDFDKLPNKKINVGYSSKNQTITTLDSIDRKLSSKNLLIKDGEEPIAIAGVIGGNSTEIDNKTKNIFIESALFDPIVIRRSAKSVDVSTDASRRYERSVDPQMAKIAIDILSGLIIKYAGGKACKGFIQSGDNVNNNNKVVFNIDDCNKFLGTSLEEQDIEDVLNKVNINYQKNKKEYSCIVPSYRMHDVKRDVDIYEEVARVVGFNNIKNDEFFSINYNMISKSRFDVVDNVKSILSSNGFFEHYSNSLISNEEHDYFANELGVSLSNPLNKNMKYIRNSMLPGMLKAVSFNQNRQIKNYKLFEVGAIYESFQETPPPEETCLGIVWPIIKFDHWKDNSSYDFFDSKGDIDKFLNQFNIIRHDYFAINKKGFEVCYSIKVQNKEIGYIGLVDSSILKKSDIKNDLVFSSISVDKLRGLLIDKNRFKAPSIYPVIERDISILVSAEYDAKKITDSIKKAGGKRLKDVYLFDVYADKSFKDANKSYGFKMVFQSDVETLKDHEIDEIMDKILSKLKSNFNVVQR